MARDYLNIRLSYEAKYWIEQLQECKQQELDKHINDGLIENIENEIIEKKADLLEGVSVTTILKVSSSSIVEAAFKKTEKNSIAEWHEIMEKTPIATKNIDYQKEIGTLTPRLYLDTNIIEGLENYRITFKTEKNIRSLKMSYIIKCVVYAYYAEIFNDLH